MGATGSTTIDFGDAPARATEASVAVTGQATIVAGSKVEAYMMPVELIGANGHNEDEHMLEDLKFTVPVSTVVAGTGFTIRGECKTGTTNGKFTVNWVWT
jgi:hypothetical protein